MVAETKKILITGSEGMLGQALCPILAKKYKIFKATCNNCDITKKEIVFKVIKKFKPDFLIHAAAFTDVDGCQVRPREAYLVNVKGTENIVKAAKKFKIKLIFISTDYVFDGNKKLAYSESDLASPLNVYGSSKLEAERIIQERLGQYFIIRTSWLYGARGKNFVDTIIKKALPCGRQAKKEKVLSVVSDQIGSPTYTVDLAKAILRLLDFNIYVPYGIYHVTNSGKCSWFEFAKEILKVKKIKAKIIPITSKECLRPAKRPKMSLLDNGKFNKFCDYGLRSWNLSLKDYVR